MTIMRFLLEWTLRSSVLILGATLLLWLSRVKDSSIRCAAWTAMLFGSLAIPLLAEFLPRIPVRISLTTTVVPGVISDGPAIASPGTLRPITEPDRRNWTILERVNWVRNALCLYALGALLLLLRVGVGMVMSIQLLRRSRSTDRVIDGIEVRESGEITAPVTLGISHPAIVLPTDWHRWDAGKLNAVLAHECSHARRRDPAVQLLSAIHRALLWHDPLSWFLHRRVVQAAEEASDDLAIVAVPDRAAYAEVLLEFMQRGVRKNLQGVPMARYGRQEDRIQRILDGTKCSRGITRWSIISILALGTSLACVAATAHPQDASSRPMAATVKVKIQKINIQGNQVLTTAQIKGVMRLIKEGSSSIVPVGKDRTDLQLQDDVTRIHILYGESGYVRVNIPEPIINLKSVKLGQTVENEYSITIKIEERDQYRIGNVKLTGNKQFTTNEIRGVLDLVPGEVYNETMLRNNFTKLRRMYESRGFMNFAATPNMNLDDAKKVVNLTINIHES